MQMFMGMLRAAFPDAHLDVHHVIAENDMLVGHWTMTATQKDGRRKGEDRRWLDRRGEPRVGGAADRRESDRRAGRDRRNEPRS